MKWFSSFRARLILTVFPVVAAVSVATLVLAEWRFMAAYTRLFEEQFESQIHTYGLAKSKRTDALSARLTEIAARNDLQQAVARSNFNEAGQILRPLLEELATERLQTELPAGLSKAGQAGPRRQILIPRGNDDKGGKDRDDPPRLGSRLPPSQQPYIAIIDPEGNFMTGPKKTLSGGRGGPPLPSLPMEGGMSAEFRRKSGRLQWLGHEKLERVLKEQEIGYLRVEYGEENQSEQVREVFITPLHDPDNGKFAGAFLFGLPLPVLAERLLYEQTKRSEFGEIMSGVWVEDALVSTTIPKDKRAEIAERIAATIRQAKRIQREIIQIDGVRHQLFYRILNPGSPFPLAAQVNLYSLAVMDRELAELRREVGGLGLVALLIALLVVLYISRGLSGPISELVGGTHEIEQGNFDVRVPVRRKDELGRLASSFNEMAAGLALQEKYRSVLNAVADRTVAAQLIEQSSGLGGEVRHVSMLFCDIRGFTALTENMPPADVIELLNEHMTALTDVAYQHGGIVDKFVGDLIMVLFGAPVSTGEDACRAVKCALHMISVRRELNQTSRHSLEVGIGIATGSVVAGCMGSDQRLSYTVLGHRVNLASRLCSIAQAGEIVLDEETYAETKELVQAEAMPPMQLKGFSGPVHPWRVTA
ncbi:MAG: adenylate/guanylate cyclase domain-containing protein [Prosthecobacter sp.]|uniref:adenylate/guanylate cyclase domain-containing protein n=1 Tax=Prosthecobacter sp. TaxID=1965333 RepID=UPI001A00FEDA|nr:adenylate/guanylate cyclase domain-containing protein [Prosthecobacter sp.]MBE2283127.1 adenylate/guanylate cyclase domain-containing protein [Prosthecobacter sp.]